jgi:hypothetical protein
MGRNALGNTTTASYNVAMGYHALISNTTGSYNTALGRHALLANTTSGSVTAVGNEAGLNSTGTGNTFVGGESGKLVTTGTENSCFGLIAGSTTTTGSNNTALGYNAQHPSNTSSNNVTLGDSNIGALRCNQTSISSLSDGRDKTDVVDLPVGLDFVNLLRPVKFKWQRREPDVNDGKIRSGFIAQELQSVQGDNDYLDLVFDDNPDKLEAKQGNLIPVLVKAIQELSVEVNALKAA